MMLANATALASRVAQGADVGEQVVDDLLGGGDVHRGREGVVRRLAAVDVVVGVDRLLAAHDAAGELDGAVADHLVDVHVGLRAAAGLPHAQREVVVELAVDDLVGGVDDALDLVPRQLTELAVGQRGGLLEDAERADHRAGEPVLAD
jgi:hypothetical protein